MLLPVLLTALLWVAMLLPYLPGSFDASAVAVSLMVQVGSYVSLLLVPVGLAWLASRKRETLWRRLALVIAGLIALALTLAGAAADGLAMGALAGAGALALSWTLWRQPTVAVADASGAHEPRSGHSSHGRMLVPLSLVCIPLVLVAFRTTVVVRAAEWSRERAIRQAAPLIAAIEAYRERRGVYPVSLRSLNPDVPTGVMGIERFHYEPVGDAYNLYFIRPHIELDAMEVVLFNPRDEHRFTSHEMDILQYDGEELDRRRGDRRRMRLAQPHWISILFD